MADAARDDTCTTLGKHFPVPIKYGKLVSTMISLSVSLQPITSGTQMQNKLFVLTTLGSTKREREREREREKERKRERRIIITAVAFIHANVIRPTTNASGWACSQFMTMAGDDG
jgi:hypothetical protein